MIADNRVLARKRFEAGKDLHTPARTANRHEKRAAQRHAKLLEASRIIRVVGQKNADSTEEKSEKRQKGTLRAEIEKVEAPAGFARTGAGLLVSLALAIELAAAAACGGIAWDEDADEDADTGDVATDVETGDVEDETPTEGTDVQPDETHDADVEEADAEDEGSTEVEAADADADVEEDGDAEEDGGCEPTTYDETMPAEPSGFLCGIAKQKIVTVRVTEFPAGCGIPRSTSLESVVFRVLGPLPADLTCARGEETEGLNPGIYLIVSLTTAELQIGIKLASALHIDSIGSGTTRVAGGDYGITPFDINGAYVRCNLDRLGTFLRTIDVWDTGTSAINAENAAMSWAIDSPFSSLGLIRLPLFIATHGGTVYYEGLSDEGPFSVRMNIDGAGPDDRWGFYRIRTKK